MQAPRLIYIIASTMRTGSYLLCEGMIGTGVAGHPREIFSPDRRSDYAGEWKLPEGVPLDAFLRAAMALGMTDNGVFGAKIHGHHVEPIAQECRFDGEPWQILRRLFPDAMYVRLTRRNRRAQAISWYRAMRTNQWWKIPGLEDEAGKEPPFDGAEIRRMELELERQEQGWDRFFATRPGAAMLKVEYEALAADYRGEVARALEFIGEDAKLAKKLPKPRLERQADALSREWMKRMDGEYPVPS